MVQFKLLFSWILKISSKLDIGRLLHSVLSLNQKIRNRFSPLLYTSSPTPLFILCLSQFLALSPRNQNL